MEQTRRSLFYVAAYLLTGGLGLLAAPGPTLTLFLARGAYDDVMVRFVGVLMLALGILVVQIIRLRAEKLYPSTVLVRFLVLAALSFFFLLTSDPLFLVLFAVVGLGVAGTLAGLLLDRDGR